MDIIKRSKRQILNVKPVIELDKDTALSFVCDSVVFIPTKKYKNMPVYKEMDVVLFRNGEPAVRLTHDSDVVYIEPSTRSMKIDVASRNGLTRIFPTFGRFRVDWNCVDLHITRLPNDDETV